jgi:hypothetical protein
MKTIFFTFAIFFSFVLFGQRESFTQTESIQNPFEKVWIYPNPTSEILFIHSDSVISSFEIINMQGKIVLFSNSGANVISLVDLPVGNYFLNINIGTMQKRFRIQKQ